MDWGGGYGRRGGKIADPHELVPAVAWLTCKYRYRSGRRRMVRSEKIRAGS